MDLFLVTPIRRHAMCLRNPWETMSIRFRAAFLL
jgi:hypothetical protein